MTQSRVSSCFVLAATRGRSMKNTNAKFDGNAGLKGAQLLGDKSVNSVSNVRHIDNLFGKPAKDPRDAATPRDGGRRNGGTEQSTLPRR